MATRRGPVQRFLLLRLLRVTLVAGALYSLVLAASLAWVAPTTASRWGIPLPDPSFYRHPFALLLVVLAVLQVIAASDVRRYSGVIAVTIAARLTQAVLFGLAARTARGVAGLAWLSGAELGLGVALALLFWPLSR